MAHGKTLTEASQMSVLVPSDQPEIRCYGILIYICFKEIFYSVTESLMQSMTQQQ